MKILFLDESGDHNLSVIDPKYPMFVLGGVIVDQAYAEGEMEHQIRVFKRELFGREDIILHTADITRNRLGFERMIEPEFRERFYQKLNALMRRLCYQVVACVIRKEDRLRAYGLAALDPYLMSLDVLVERFCMEIGDVTGGGIIIAEKRNPTLDHQLELAWLNLKVQGTRFLQAKTLEKRILAVMFLAKPSRKTSKSSNPSSGATAGENLMALDSLCYPVNEMRPAPATQLPAHATIIGYRGRYVKPIFLPRINTQPTIHLSGIPRDAMETTFSGSRPNKQYTTFTHL